MVTLAPYDFDEHVEYAHFIDDQPVFALADGRLRFPTYADKVIEVHEGLLCADRGLDGRFLMSGGEDGRVMRTSLEGAVLVCEQPRKWIDVLCCGPQGAVGFASGRSAWVSLGDKLHHFEHERAVEGLDFAPKGMRLASARYNGVSVNWVSGAGQTVDLHWDGAHIGVLFSPDGRFIVTSMSENALHGWRLDNKASGEGKHMRMTGYPAKPKSLSWSAKGKYLASSGAQAAICWPFFGKEGPMGKAPKELGTRGDAMVTQVACHPSQDVVAIGYNDGMVMAVKIEDASEVLLRRPGKGAVSTLNWDNLGKRLVFGSEEGEAGVIDITS